jgi:hypothetical protein
MASLIPHPPHAEDQPYAKTYMTFHVLSRTLVAGSLLSIPTSIASTFYYGPKTLSTFAPRLLLHSFRGSIAGLALGLVALEGRMWGREDIEWQDRTWRLLENKGQVEVDGWIVGDGLLGGVVAAVAARRGLVLMGVMRSFAGGMGLGSVLGTGEYMGWRYGVNKGQWPDEKIELNT